MKNFTIILLLVTTGYVNAQWTAIPDPNFEQALYNLGLDITYMDGQVLTANIDTVTNLTLPLLSGIIDLKGIEDFTVLTYLDCGLKSLANLDVSQNTALTVLHCDYNKLTSLDVTQNTALTLLSCDDNQLTSLDLTQNTALTILGCNENQLTNLDLTQNTALTILTCNENLLTNLDITQHTALTFLDCSFNQLTSLDLTQNTALTQLGCYNNPLYCLNMKNGNNVNIISVIANNNSNLTCIEVDDAAYSTTNWVNIMNYFDFDPQSYFSTNCPNPCSVGIDEHSLTNFSLYPNPVKDIVTIEMEGVKNQEYYLYSIIGELVQSGTIASDNNTINVADLPANVYLLKMGNSTTKLIITK